MPQLVALREIDDLLDAAFSSAGMADAATYTAPTIGAQPVPCTVLVDRSVQYVGGDSRAGSLVTTISVRAEIDPQEKGRIAIGAEVFSIDRIESRDESRVLCICKVGR